MMAKSPAPVSERKQPEAFCLSLGMRRPRSAWLLSERTRRLVRKRRTSLRRPRSCRMRLQAGDCLTPPAGAGTARTGRIAGFGFRLSAFGFDEDGVVAGPQVLAVAGGQRLKVLGLGLADHGIGLA